MDPKIQYTLQAVAHQRNQAMDNCAALSAEHAAAEQRAEALNARLEDTLAKAVVLANELPDEQRARLVELLPDVKDRLAAAT